MTELTFSSPHYRLELAPTGLFARLYSPQGDELAALRPLAALDTVDGTDETLGVSLRREGDTFVVERRSTRWEEASVTLVCRDDAIEVRTRVRGRGELTDVRLLAGRSLIPGSQVGYVPSGSRFRMLFSPSPGEPASHLRPATESAAIGVLGDSDPGRRHWLFTPPPLLFGLTSDHDVSDPGVTLADGWTTFAVAAPVSELDFVELTYEAFESAFALRLDYDGHTRVDGEFEAPLLVIGFGAPDAYAAIARHRDDLVARGAAPAPAARETPAWWHEPIFCGWGAQCRLANLDGGERAAAFATQARYDEFLGHLEGEGIVPGTITLDDKWQADYGTNEPDLDKWPDLAGWIAERHERGQRVLLWWKAWDPNGAPPELCVRNPDGAAIGLDPSNPATRAFVHEMLGRMLGSDGLDADGLKIDFTARTPSGRALSHHGPAWGIALLHQLLRTVYEAAKAAKPDALVVTHTPHPAFADVTDMIRLNDVVGGSSVADQMRIRAEIVRAALPALPIDTDDWCVPNLEQWREYLADKTSHGVPALYYSDALDASGETFAPEDYAALRESWAAWRSGR